MKIIRKPGSPYPRANTHMVTLAIAGSFAAVLIAGCSTNAPTPAAAALNNAELTFNLSQCLPIEAHVYKCPAVDKPICDADYAGGAYTQCIRLGKKGSVYVTGPGGE